ncbi:response regulator transcription factor [Aeromonas veronii]|uniref:response regulator transcription factor n=1 Tax=Aeromonas veronii TaxID=654 RepID=UPI00226D3F6C|nr:response regulator transcription factor [Aeromonas veronii]MCX9114735.1 response regulator transcription factor [Aeromonas veronii]
MNQVLRCIIVDDHPAIRMALRMTLSKAGGEVIAESGSGDEALKLIRTLQPDIVLLDLDLPGIDGQTLLERLKHHSLSCRIIVLSAIDNEHLAARVRAAGAHGYMHKSESLDLLPMVIKLVSSGYSYFSDQVLTISEKHYTNNEGVSILGCLSKRELTVFRHLAKGDNNSQIANYLALSPKTVSTYKTRIFEKLNISSLLELIEVAKREGL